MHLLKGAHPAESGTRAFIKEYDILMNLNFAW